ncbi:MAG: undecaprenyl-diphosphatase UppP [candidate division Zixibacteria bacterium]|nr:undecaprenyl-diphosphatase UppP [candidate division Zixibacteria bacterium]
MLNGVGLTLIQALILGIVQGLTEFLPVSSSGHLVIFEHLLDTHLENINFDVFVHTGTLLAVLVFYRRQLISLTGRFFKTPFDFGEKGREEDAGSVPVRWVWFIVLGTIPAVIIGLGFEDAITSIFKNVKLVGGVLIACGVILISTGFAKKGSNSIGLWHAIIIGLAQAMAITPGLSRSGMTISAGLFMKIDPRKAADFSFLLSIPAVAGATILKISDVVASPPHNGEVTNYIIGGTSAFIVGYACIAWLLHLVKRGKFFYFGIYCGAAGLISILFIS